MTFKPAALVLAAAATGHGLCTGVADAGPFCYETGPGYEKCLSSPSGDYFNPIYVGSAERAWPERLVGGLFEGVVQRGGNGQAEQERRQHHDPPDDRRAAED